MITNNKLETEKAAKYLNVTVGTLAAWRSTKRHMLPYYKIGSRKYYDIMGLDAFIQSKK